MWPLRYRIMHNSSTILICCDLRVFLSAGVQLHEDAHHNGTDCQCRSNYQMHTLCQSWHPLEVRGNPQSTVGNAAVPRVQVSHCNVAAAPSLGRLAASSEDLARRAHYLKVSRLDFACCRIRLPPGAESPGELPRSNFWSTTCETCPNRFHDVSAVHWLCNI